MRISTNMIYETGIGSLQRQTADLLHTHQQVSTGKRVLTPADDPIAAARILEMGQSKAVNAQFKQNIAYADDNMKLLEGKLVSVGEIMQYTRERAVQAGNGTMTQTDLNYIATDMKSQFKEMMGLANTKDGLGNYIFSGYKSNTQPYTGGLTGMQYHGDQGDRTIQVSASRFMPISLPGSDIFDRARPVDVTTVRAATAENPTTNDALYSFKGKHNEGTASALTVSFDAATVNPDQHLGKRYILQYNQPNPAVTGSWQVSQIAPDGQRTTISPTATPPPPAAPTNLTFNGISVDVPADPPPVNANDKTPLANGDAFEVFVASTNSFENMSMFIGALEHNNEVGVAGGVAFALDNSDLAQETLLKTRAQIGSQMVETKQLADLGEGLNIEYESAISRLENVDYNQAISTLVQQQTYLQAAQRSFLRISGLSLFNLIN